MQGGNGVAVVHAASPMKPDDQAGKGDGQGEDEDVLITSRSKQ